MAKKTDNAQPSSSPRWRGWLLEGALVLAVVIGVTAYQGRNLLPSGEAAPRIDGIALASSEPVQLPAAAASGRKTVLYFWAPWCTVCKANSPVLSELSERADVDVVGVAVGGLRQRSQVQAFVREHEVRYDVVLAPKAVAQEYKVAAFPTAYILDEQGRIAHQVVGYTSMFGYWWRLL